MYTCQGCNKTQKPGVPCNIVPISSRPKQYNNEGKLSSGWEIVRELELCAECAEKSYLQPVMP